MAAECGELLKPAARVEGKNHAAYRDRSAADP